ncbi:MAG: ArsA family ATPase [Acidobacteria bacterium]|nr:ArsA family ATPase [Acidobacteriota bacterium]
MDTINDILASRGVVVCVGTGGAGKTSVSAALALAAAENGRRVALVTIDPARRLADALGLAELSNDPRPVPLESPAGNGSLEALMLDAKGTFDALVSGYARDPEQAQRILSSKFYTNVSTTLSGTHEYMAMEKLYELHASGDYDLLVVDTPPTRSALAFLDAPVLLARLLDNWLYRVLTAPGRGVVRAANKAAQLALRQLSRIIGAEVVEDAVTFFQAFEGMEDGFRQRAESVLKLLKSADAAFVLVATARDDTLAEADHFVGQLAGSGISIAAMTFNRMTPIFAQAAVTNPSNACDEVLATLQKRRKNEDALIDAFTEPLDIPVIKVPLIDDDVHDLPTLRKLAREITGA